LDEDENAHIVAYGDLNSNPGEVLVLDYNSFSIIIL